MPLPDVFTQVQSVADLPNLTGVTTESLHILATGLSAASVGDALRVFLALDREAIDAVNNATAAIEALLLDAIPLYQRGGRVFYVGAGTSGRLGVIDAAEVPPTFNEVRFVGIIAGGSSAMTLSAEAREDDPLGSHEMLRGHSLTDRDVVIAVTASGRTPYALGALEFASSFGALTGLICNSPPADPKCAKHVIVLRTGAEIPAGSTRMKAGTAQNLVLKRISTLLNAAAGHIFRGVMVNVRPTNKKLVARAVGIICRFTGAQPDEALELLRAAEGNVKLALVMYHTMDSFQNAHRALERATGSLEPIIGKQVDSLLRGERPE